MRDAETLIAYLREAADELEKAHGILDQFGVPRCIPGHEPTECTLAARIVLHTVGGGPSQAAADNAGSV